MEGMTLIGRLKSKKETDLIEEVNPFWSKK